MELDAAFGFLDLNRDGVISRDEFMAAVQHQSVLWPYSDPNPNRAATRTVTPTPTAGPYHPSRPAAYHTPFSASRGAAGRQRVCARLDPLFYSPVPPGA
jgi:hypothetical protein